MECESNFSKDRSSVLGEGGVNADMTGTNLLITEKLIIIGNVPIFEISMKAFLHSISNSNPHISTAPLGVDLSILA